MIQLSLFYQFITEIRMMNKQIFVSGGKIVNEGRIIEADILIEGDYIKKIYGKDESRVIPENAQHIDASNKYIFPGVIDDQVHFREPGLTHKGGIYSESRAAVAGGITTFFEMPNTSPQTTTLDLLESKYEIASQKSLANYSFYLGATNDNLDEIVKEEIIKIKEETVSVMGDLK